MALLVQKFGGTSVGTTERIEAVAEKVCRFRKEGHDVVVVVSAMSGETNRLIGLANDIMEEPTPREMDVLVSTGEQVTIALLSMALQKRGCDARSYTGAQVRILTDSSHTKARIKQIDEQLEFWPQIVIHKCKQRLTKMTQYLIRMRRMRLKPRKTLERVHKKSEVRDERREVKAEKAARIDRAIENELLERLQAGTCASLAERPD